jgi:GTP-sensing pleiotropic transcriptional regulator CodY
VGIANKDLAIIVKKLNHKLESAGVLECWSVGVLE